MIVFLLFVIAVIWLIGACVRVYRQARFYQIEEYSAGRYLRWILRTRTRWLPSRTAGAWFIGAALSFMFSEAPDGGLPALIGIISAIIAVIPPAEGEIKKAFRATARAKRLLATAFTLSALMIIGGALIVVTVLADAAPEIRVIAVDAIGFLTFISAPLLLVIANALMTPVEAAFRGRFIAQARRVLDAVHPTVIGITGSYGKTSTKTYLAHILSGRYKVYATPKSYNTLMGVCIAINNDLAHDHSIDIFIVEMGAYIRGEIERICDLTHPEIGIVIEVGPQHLERFGSLETVAAAKYELIKALPPDGVGVFNGDNPHVLAMAERGHPAARLIVSKSAAPVSAAQFIASDIRESLEGLSFRVTDTQTGESETFITPLLGVHNVTNLLLCSAVAVHEGMSLREIAWRVRHLEPAESRLVRQTTPEGITIINDAYSANPVGIESALQVLGMHTTGRRLLITPGMVELGARMDTENQRLGAIAAQHATDVILVGREQTLPIQRGLSAANFPEDRLHVVDTLSEAIQWYKTQLQAGDSVLFLNDLPDTYQS